MYSPPFISIIIPVYNAEPYIGQCIESVIAQSISDWELILVDDGSTDHSFDVCKLYQEKDHRIRLIHVENGGASKARNIGINQSKGEWILFIDADDWVDTNIFEIIRQSPNFDIVFFGFVEHRNNFVKVKQICNSSYDSSKDIDTALSNLFLSKERFFGFTVNKFYRKSIIDKYNLRFNESLIIKEDEEFLIRYCRFISSVYVSNETPYHYRILQTSISHRGLKFKNLVALAKCIETDLREYPWNKFKRDLLNQTYLYFLRGVLESQDGLQKSEAIDGFIKFVEQNTSILNSDLPYRSLFNVKPDALKKGLIRIVPGNPILSRLKVSYIKLQFQKFVTWIKR